MKKIYISLPNRKNFRLINKGKVDIPIEIEIPIYLIRSELKNRMLFKHLTAIGFQDCYFENFLHRLILASLGMSDGTDETFKIYFDLMEKWTDHINADDDVITRRALKIYATLITARDGKIKHRKVEKKTVAKGRSN